MRNSITRRSLFVAIPALACFCLASEAPILVLERFCRLDFDGARVGLASSDGVGALVMWKAEPGWDSCVLVRAFQVGKPETRGATTKATVDYQVVGRWEGEDPIVMESATKSITFSLVLQHDHWLIDSEPIEPHVSIPTAIKLVERLIEQEKDHQRRQVLLADLERLRTLK